MNSKSEAKIKMEQALKYYCSLFISAYELFEALLL